MSHAAATIPVNVGKVAGSSSPIFRNSLLFASVSFAAYLLSLVKTIIVSRYFGTSAEMDAFTIAILVPNLLGSLLVSSASAGLVPALAAAERNGAQARADTYRTCFLLFTGACVIVSIALAVFGGWLIPIIAPSFAGERLLRAQELAAPASLLLLLTGIYAFASAELLSRKKYAAVAAAPGISSLLSLLGILKFHSRGAAVLVWALVAGLVVQALVVSIPAWKASAGGGFNSKPNPYVSRALWAQLTLLAVSSIGVANSFVDQVISTWLPVGNLSSLSYASNLNMVAMQVVVMSMGWVLLPDLSQMAATQQFNKLRRSVRVCVVTAVMMAVPACLLIVGFGQTALRMLFQHGRFHADSTRLVYLAWAGYSVGLIPAAIGMTASRVANALHENRLLLRIGFILLIANAALDYLLMRFIGVLGITLSTSIVYCFSTVLLYRGLRAEMGTLLDTATIQRIAKAVCAAVAAAVPVAALRFFAGDGVFASGAQLVAFSGFLVITYKQVGLLTWSDTQSPGWRPWRWLRLLPEEY